MPYKSVYVEPELFHEYNGVKVYHTYDMGEIEERSGCYFSTNQDETELDFTFDVRELPDFDQNDHPPFVTGEDDTPENRRLWKKWHGAGNPEKQYKIAMEKAIDKGIIQQNEIVKLK